MTSDEGHTIQRFAPRRLSDALTGLAIAGRYAYVTSIAGLTIVDLDNPLSPARGRPRRGTLQHGEAVPDGGTRLGAESRASRLRKHMGRESDGLILPQSVAVQFRYAFVTDPEGLKIFDVTDPYKPRWWSKPVATSGRRPHLRRPHLRLHRLAPRASRSSTSRNPEKPAPCTRCSTPTGCSTTCAT